MNTENLYETIFKRKSIRKYDFTSLDDNTISAISEYIDNLKPMYDNIKTEMKLVSQKDLKGIAVIKAPYYIVALSEKKEGYLTNVGFMLQQMDLFLSSNGIGTCWVGMSKAAKEISESSKLEFVIVLALGKPEGPLYRSNVSEFKRKSLNQISNTIGSDDLLETVRIAPSSSNSQPWFFTKSDDIIHGYCVKSNLLKAIMYEKVNRIDMGIAMYHLWIAAKHFGKDAEIISDITAGNNPPDGYYYISSIKLR